MALTDRREPADEPAEHGSPERARYHFVDGGGRDGSRFWADRGADGFRIDVSHLLART